MQLLRPKRSLSLVLVCLTTLLACTGCEGKSQYNIADFQNETARTQFNESLDLSAPPAQSSDVPADFNWVCEAEDAQFVGNVSEANIEFPGYSGKGYVGGFQKPEDQLVFSLEIEHAGIYDLSFRTCAGAYKVNPVFVDGENVGSITTPEEPEFTESVLAGIYLEAGTHKIAAGTEWGYYFVDKLTMTAGTPISNDVYDVTAPLSDEKAFENTKRLYKFLCDCYGKYTITGQYCDKGKFGTEMNLIYEQTGQYPAILGLDMMDYCPVRVEMGGGEGQAVAYAQDFYCNKGGIVTMCWHWTPQKPYLVNNAEHPWYSGFYKEAANIDLDAIASGADEDAKASLIADIDAICEAMQPLKEAQVPILWRPLHEASGGWFWWGDCKPESYQWLWNLVYDKMVNEHGLHNLIWVWNGQDKDWYPGDETVDIIGMDIYAAAHTYTSQSSSFAELTTWSGERKLIALSENGCMPDPELMVRDHAVWSWFATWGGDFIHKFYQPVEDYTEFEMWKKVFQSEHSLSLDDLPCLWTYPLE